MGERFKELIKNYRSGNLYADRTQQWNIPVYEDSFTFRNVCDLNIIEPSIAVGEYQGIEGLSFVTIEGDIYLFNAEDRNCTLFKLINNDSLDVVASGISLQYNFKGVQYMLETLADAKARVKLYKICPKDISIKLQSKLYRDNYFYTSLFPVCIVDRLCNVTLKLPYCDNIDDLFLEEFGLNVKGLDKLIEEIGISCEERKDIVIGSSLVKMMCEKINKCLLLVDSDNFAEELLQVTILAVSCMNEEYLEEYLNTLERLYI